MSPEQARVYNKSEWSQVPKSKYKRIWYHSMSPERKEQFLADACEYQRRKRAEKRAAQAIPTGEQHANQTA